MKASGNISVAKAVNGIPPIPSNEASVTKIIFRLVIAFIT